MVALWLLFLAPIACSRTESIPDSPRVILLETEQASADGKPILYLPIDAKVLPDGGLAVLYENRGIKRESNFKLMNWLVVYDSRGKRKQVIDPGMFFAHSLVLSPQDTYLISDHGNRRILEIDKKGKILLEINEIPGSGIVPDFNSAALTADGNILACVRDWGIVEFDRKGRLLWKQEVGLSEGQKGNSFGFCHDATNTPGGQILFAKTCTDEVIEMDRDGKVVWKFHNEKIRIPKNAKRKENGNTVIAYEKGLAEVTPEGTIVRERSDFGQCYNFDLLPGDEILLTRVNQGILLLNNRFETLREYKPDSLESWDRMKNSLSPEDADRLKSLGYMK